MMMPQARADGSFCSTKLARLVCAFAVRYFTLSLPFNSHSILHSSKESLFYWYIQKKKEIWKLYETLEDGKN